MMNRLSEKHCEVCMKRGIRKKVRTLCDECRELLCKECSDTHLLFKLSKNHSLIDLDPPGEEARSTNEDELALNFEDQAKVSETTELYRAQTAVEGGSKILRERERKTEKEKENGATRKEKNADISKWKPKKIAEFSVNRLDDKSYVSVHGVLTLTDKFIIVDYLNMKLKLYDRSGNYLSSTDLKDFTKGVTQVNTDRFATCGEGNKVFLWTLRCDTIVSEDVTFDVDNFAEGIIYNNTYYCVLHSFGNAVTILDKQGARVRKIVMKMIGLWRKIGFGKIIDFGWDIHMDSGTHNIYIPCFPDNSGVLCMSVEGEILWFTPLSDAYLSGITETHGVLCVADQHGQCLHLISKTGQYKGKLLEKEGLGDLPYHILYDEHEQKLCVSYNYNSDKRDIISMYSV